MNSFAQFSVMFDQPDTTFLCKNSSLNVTVTASSQYPISSYAWSTGENTSSVTIKEPGTFYVTVMNSNDEKTIDSLYIELVTPDASIYTKDTSVCSSGEGFYLKVANGNGSFAESDYIYNGEHYFDVMYAPRGENYIHYTVIENDCSATDSILVNVVSINATTQTEGSTSCENGFIGSATLEVEGGIEPYSFKWDNGVLTKDLETVPEGYYYVTITDSIGCYAYSYADLYNQQGSEPIAYGEFINDAEEKYAPFVAHIKNYSENYCNTSWSVTANGESHYYSNDDLEFVCETPGTYTFTMGVFGFDGGDGTNAAYKTFTADILQAPIDTAEQSRCKNVKVSFNIKDNVCNGENKGAVRAIVSGGSEPYRYLWSTTRTDNMLKNLKAGRYSLTVTDMEGCKKVQVAEVKDSSALFLSSLDITHPSSCTASDGAITANIDGGTNPYTFLWNNGSTLNSLTKLANDNYSFTITDGHGCTYKEKITLQSTDAPSIYINRIGSSSCDKTSGFIDIYFDTYNKIGTWDDENGTALQRRTNLPAGNYSLTVKDTTTKCVSKRSITVPKIKPLKQEICVVTVSPETGKNLIIWEPVQTANEIDYYTIYKEDTITNEFVLLDKVSSGELSVFRDENSDPRANSDRYKISATNYCGIESELSKEHKTIFLRSAFNVDDYVEIIQDFYEGRYINSYNLYADSKFGPDIKLASYDALTQEAWISSISKDDGYRSLYITVEIPNACDPISQNSLKSDSGPFSQSISNISEAQLTDNGEELLVKMNLLVSPSPSNGKNISVKAPENGVLSVLSIDGKTRFKTEISAGLFTLPHLPNGLYIIKLKGNKDYHSTFIVN